MPSMPYESGSSAVMKLEDLALVGEREHGAGEKVDRHHQEVHDELKSLHVLKAGTEDHAQRREEQSDQHHESDGHRNGEPIRRPEAGDEANNQNQQPLDDSYCTAAQGAADHDLNARHRSHQRLFKKSKLAVPQAGRGRKRLKKRAPTFR